MIHDDDWAFTIQKLYNLIRLRFKSIDYNIHTCFLIIGSNGLDINISVCGPGNFVDSADNTCKPCAIGSYNEENQASSCTACPSAMTTAKAGSKAYKDCGKPSITSISSNRSSWKTSIVVVKVSMNKKELWISVRVDDKTAERRSLLVMY